MARQKILLADDDKNFLEALKEQLEAAGYETISAHEGIRVVQLAHMYSPDLILLDWKMPVGKGNYVIENLMAEDDTRHIPIIILTGVDDPEIEEVMKIHHVRALIRKPYDKNELFMAINNALNTEYSRF